MDVAPPVATTLPSFHPMPGLTTAPEETEAQQDPGPAAGGWQPRLPEAYSRFSECVSIRPCHRGEAYASLLAHLCGDSGDRKSERGRTPLWPWATPSLPRPLPRLCRGGGRALLPPPPPRPLAQDRGGHEVPESPQDRGRRAEAGSLPSRATAIAREKRVRAGRGSIPGVHRHPQAWCPRGQVCVCRGPALPHLRAWCWARPACPPTPPVLSLGREVPPSCGGRGSSPLGTELGEERLPSKCRAGV